MTGLTPKFGFPVENESGEDIPACAVVLVTGVETSTDGHRTWSKVTRYDGTDGNLMVTGNVTVANQMLDSNGDSINGRGTAYFDNFLYVAVDDTESDPVSGEEWGPESGSWVLHKGGSGFIAQGFSLTDVVPKRALFLRCCGSGGSSLTPYVITEVEYSTGNNVAVYRNAYTVFAAKPADDSQTGIEPDSVEVDLYARDMRGVSFTGQIVLAETIKGKPYAVKGWGGQIFHNGGVVDGINAGDVGEIRLGYLDVAGDIQFAKVMALNTVDRGLAADTPLLETTFDDGMQTFSIIVAGCG